MIAWSRTTLAVAAAGALALAPAVAHAQASEWSVDEAASSIRFSGTHAGRAFSGKFENWTARIRFDPDNLAQSRIIVIIDTSTAMTGDKVQESTLANSEWFDVANHRFARFQSSKITSRGGNRYSAQGTLEIKGAKTSVTLPFTLAIDGNQARGTGSLTLDRIALGMGTKSDPRAQWVSRNINLSVSVSAIRGRPAARRRRDRRQVG